MITPSDIQAVLPEVPGHYWVIERSRMMHWYELQLWQKEQPGRHWFNLFHRKLGWTVLADEKQQITPHIVSSSGKYLREKYVTDTPVNNVGLAGTYPRPTNLEKK